MDLLDQMTIDLKRRVAIPAPAGEPEDSADAFAEVERDMGSCDVAFTQGDAKAMAECLIRRSFSVLSMVSTGDARRSCVI